MFIQSVFVDRRYHMSHLGKGKAFSSSAMRDASKINKMHQFIDRPLKPKHLHDIQALAGNVSKGGEKFNRLVSERYSREMGSLIRDIYLLKIYYRKKTITLEMLRQVLEERGEELIMETNTTTRNHFY